MLYSFHSERETDMELMSREEIMKELIAAEEAGDVESAEYWQSLLDHGDFI